MFWVNSHLNALTFGIGLVFLYVGAWHWSIGAANLLLGSVAVVLGATPYVMRFWRR